MSQVLPLLLALALASTASGQWVEDSIETGQWVYNLVYNYREGRVLGTSWGGNGVFSIWCERGVRDGATRVDRPLGLALNPMANRVYCSYESGEDEGVAVLRGSPPLLIYKRIPLAGAWHPFWDSVSNRIYVSCGLENEVAVIDCATDSVIDRIPVGDNPVRPELNTRHRKLYVRNWDGESATIIDLRTNQVIRTISLGNVPMCGYYCPASDKYYCGTGRRVQVICGAGDTVVSSLDLAVGNGTTAIAGLGCDTLIAVSAYGGTEGVYFVDTRTDTTAAFVPAARQPQALTYSQSSGLLYCACASSDEVAILRADGTGVQRVLSVGDYPEVMVAAPEFGYVYVGHAGGHWVYVIKDSVTGMEEPGRPREVPAGIRAWPSPFRHRLTVEVPGGTLTGPARVYSVDGRIVAEFGCRQSGGRITAEWNGRDQSGRDAPEGAYVVTFPGGSAKSVVVCKVR